MGFRIDWLALEPGRNRSIILHLLIAIVLAKVAKSPMEATFPVTRAEFQKDREWIENFQNPNKSND